MKILLQIALSLGTAFVVVAIVESMREKDRAGALVPRPIVPGADTV